MMQSLFKSTSTLIATAVALYAIFLGLLTNSWFQSHVVYLHAFKLTNLTNLNRPESFGFLQNQVTPFYIQTTDNQTLYAWHILPVAVHQEFEVQLTEETTNISHDITSRLSFKLLRDDPEALLVIHLHGAGGTVASGYRCPNYRAIGAANPSKIHVLTFDYRGFGHSTGTPSENGLIQDTLAVVDWAMHVANIPSSRILIFAQSMGTAVALAVSERLARQSAPTVFAGAILVAPFTDMPSLVATYRLVGKIPILSPLAKYPQLFELLCTYIVDQWPSKNRIAGYSQANEANNERYQIFFIHAEDDMTVPWQHSTILFRYAVNASSSYELSYTEFEAEKKALRRDFGPAGSVVEWRTRNGVIREEILKYGVHDVIMGSSVITAAAMRIFKT